MPQWVRGKKKFIRLDDRNINNFVLEFFYFMLYFEVKLKEQEQYPEFICCFVIYQMF